MSGTPHAAAWHRFPDRQALCREALRRLVAIAHDAWQHRQRFTIVLAGGSTPEDLYAVWRRQPDFDWSRTEVFWGDERAVAADDPHSNHAMAMRSLLQHVPLPSEAIHRMPADTPDLDAAARDYEERLRKRLGPRGRTDLVLLGLGTDAHTASLFPGMPALRERRRWIVATPAPEIAPRLTGTAPWFNATRNVLFLVAGTSKRQAVARVRTAAESPEQVPALLIRPHQGHTTWLLDRDADASDTALP